MIGYGFENNPNNLNYLINNNAISTINSNINSLISSIITSNVQLSTSVSVNLNLGIDSTNDQLNISFIVSTYSIADNSNIYNYLCSSFMNSFTTSLTSLFNTNFNSYFINSDNNNNVQFAIFSWGWYAQNDNYVGSSNADTVTDQNINNNIASSSDNSSNHTSNQNKNYLIYIIVPCVFTLILFMIFFALNKKYKWINLCHKQSSNTLKDSLLEHDSYAALNNTQGADVTKEDENL